MNFFFYNFTYLFLAVLGRHCYEQGLLSCCRAQALGHTGFSSCGSLTLERRLNSCIWGKLLHSM